MRMRMGMWIMMMWATGCPGLGPWRPPLGSNPRHRCAGRTKLWEATQGICVFSAGRAGQLSLEEEVQLTAMCVASQPAAPGGGASEPVAPGGGASQPAGPRQSAETLMVSRNDSLMHRIQSLGRVPKEKNRRRGMSDNWLRNCVAPEQQAHCRANKKRSWRR